MNARRKLTRSLVLRALHERTARTAEPATADDVREELERYGAVVARRTVHQYLMTLTADEAVRDRTPAGYRWWPLERRGRS